MALQVVLAAVVVVYLVGCYKGVEGAIECQAPLVVFGASMVDVGQNAAVYPNASAADFPPFGVDYFHKPASRFSNGRVLSDFISQELGYGLLSPYLQSVEPNFAHGVNFASSGSTARNSITFANVTANPRSFSLDVQVNQFKAFKAKVIRAQSKHHGSLQHLLPADGFAKAIYFMATANNDYIGTFSRPDPFDPLSLVVSVVSAIESAILELHSEGARNIIVVNVIPMGCVPAFLAHLGSQELDNDSCIASLNSVVDLHNLHLQELIIKLRKELSMNGIYVFDVNAIYLDAIRNPSKYGVMYPFMTCCGAGGGKYNMGLQCGQKQIVDGKLQQAVRCSNPAQHISWDGLHFTETFAKQVAHRVLSGNNLHPIGLSFPTICNSS